MNDVQLESRLLTARPEGATSSFTESVMEQIKHNPAHAALPISGRLNQLMGYARLHRAVALAAIIVLVSIISFTGYAYAIGSDPFSLLRRWTVGDHVNVDYKGRTFEYGKARNYSDAAITAFAELNTVSGLYFRASNEFLVPRNGVEYVNNPYDETYVYPWVGVIDRVDGDTAYLHKQYTLGDKVVASTASDEAVTLPTKNVSAFVKGEHAAASQLAPGTIVAVYHESFMAYKTGSGVKAVPHPHYFVFGLIHSLSDIKEADQANQTGQAKDLGESQGLFEPSWGGVSNICMNNGADTCDIDKLAGQAGESLYDDRDSSLDSKIPERSNPDAIAYGEGVADNAQQPDGIIMRNTEGKITKLTAAQITIKSSSGQQWILAFNDAQQKAFAQTHSPLKIGDRLGASVLESVYNLDNRTIDTQHINIIKRY
jgi:hypothetical protein